jgi:CheY-like chemotaxis protein
VEPSRVSDGRRVLIVDDEKMVCLTLAQIFQSRGYETRTTLSAEAAIELLGTWIPDIAILDVSLPHMNGVELAILLAERCPQCRLLLFSGRPESGELVEDAAKGGNFFEIVAKPVHPAFLLEWAARIPPDPAATS